MYLCIGRSSIDLDDKVEHKNIYLKIVISRNFEGTSGDMDIGILVWKWKFLITLVTKTPHWQIHDGAICSIFPTLWFAMEY